ncbi:hypothetical protein [Kamptonema formosum]|uniref:hypothetical protein n=1 Tax=Kamptonema formosum TaxID=331992 RepID=UPI00034DE252|nr:hypothetical protein [Oscillatoria sp. PCC 10802]
MNILQQGDGDLVAVNYSDLLDKILRALRNHNPFRISGDRRKLLVDIDELAASLATSAQVQNPLESSQSVRSASVNFSRGFREVFPGKVREIRECLREKLESALGETGSIQELVAGLITRDLQSFPTRKPDQLGLAYDFGKRYDNLVKQKLSLEFDRPGGESLLKFHKLTIAVRNIDEFQENLKRGLENYIEQEVPWESEEDRADLYSALDRLEIAEFSEFYQLQEIVDTETLGKLKKEAEITYLEYLRDSIETQDTAGLIYLRDLIRRLRLIEEYISADRPDGHYEVSYAGATVNYKDAFSRAEALDSLPIIPIVGGYLGENTDRSGGEIQFVFGLKLKLAGKVQALGGDEVFDYNLDIINPDSKKHQEEIGDSSKQESFAKRVLRRVLLYFFVFASRSNPLDPNYSPDSELEYDPIAGFEKVLPVLRGDNEEAKKKLFRGIVRGFNEYNVRHKISRLKELLKNFLERQTILATRTYPIQIAVRKGILNPPGEIDSMINGAFLREVLGRNPKECLRYISIGGAHVDEGALCQLPASITIEDIRYFPAEEREKFSWEYDIKGVSALAVAWVPKQDPCWEKYTKNLQHHKLILFPYDNRHLNENNPNRLDISQAFVYQFTWVVLALICLNLLLENAPDNLFVPMLRLHEGDDNNPFPVEKFLANLSKGLSHLLNEKCRCSSQGFRVKNLKGYTIANGLSSLYSVLPKKFRFVDEFPTLEKLAIIIVSSVESDARTGSRNRNSRISNLLGEVVSVTRQADGTVRLEILKTFSDNYPNWRIYRDAPVLINTVDNLYREGYRHFLYIAQAPYSSTLHITRSQGEEELYFMSPKLIKELKGERQDIKIYPVFFDKYYVINKERRERRAKSLYVTDTEQLTSVSRDPQQQAVVFFNLFNGITVGSSEERFYNGVVSYATLVNIYEGILDDMDIRRGLLEDTPLKADLLQYLTLFHFSRFEKNSNISLKLDPYENIIGDDSFGKLSIFNHMRGEIEFNALAFMTEIKKALIEEASR